MYIDFHTHLDWYNNQISLLEQLNTFNGIIVSSSVNLESCKKNQIIKNSIKNETNCKLIVTPGIHPDNADEEVDNLNQYNQILKNSPIIGEIGMDFCWSKTSPLAQEKCLRFFLEHCHINKKYCVIHTKDAEEQIARILEEYPHAKPIIHWYDGPLEIFKEFINRSYYQTFGVETIRSPHIQSLLKIMPQNLILAETDNPTAEPWLGGTDNGINLIERVYKDISTVLNADLIAVKNQINQNSLSILNNCIFNN